MKLTHEQYTMYKKGEKRMGKFLKSLKAKEDALTRYLSEQEALWKKTGSM